MNTADTNQTPVDTAANAPEASNDALPPASVAEPVVEPVAAIVEQLTPGAYLRAAREKAGLSIGDLAGRLRMGGRQIDALEKAEYAALPTGTFLRGFVRNYARAVGADSAQAIALLEQTHADGQPLKSPNIVVPSQNIKLVPAGGELASPKWRVAIALGALLLFALAFAYLWQYVRPNIVDSAARAAVEQPVDIPPATKPAPIADTPPAAVAVAPAPPATDTAPAAQQPAVNDAKPDAKPEAKADTKSEPKVERKPDPKPAAPEANAKTAATAVEKADSKPAAAPRAIGTGVLGFTFTGESWVEVTDAGGKILISRRFRAGEAEEATGKTPLSVVIGNAQATRMAFNGTEFNLAPFTRVSVARVVVK